MSVTTLRLASELEDQLEAFAQKADRSKSWIINQALREFLERQKQEESRWKETISTLSAVAEGNVVDGAEVQDWLRSWGQTNEKPSPGEKQ